jgi:hypothetical protein
MPSDVEQHGDVVIHSAHDDWAMGEFGPCLIVIWRGTVTVAALHQVNERIVNLAQRRPGHCAYINVIEKNSPLPSAQTRKLAMEGVEKPGRALTCMAAIIEGNELRSTVVRAIITGMAFLLPKSQPTKMFKDTQQMASWLKKQLPEENLEQIVPMIEVVRSKMPTARGQA